MMNAEFPIDIVIPWVDGDDPAHRARRAMYMHSGREARFDDIAGETRYHQVGEIYFCVASVLRFVSFVRRIFIITDGQDPHLGDYIASNFPGCTVPVEIVDHKTIFRGYEEYLPVFNSRAIEAVMWRIPGLSEHFIYMNDDFMFTAPVTRGDFFLEDGRPVCYARWQSAWWVFFLHAVQPSRNGHKHFGFKYSQVQGARLAGKTALFLQIEHTPRAIRRSVMERYYTEHPESIVRNIRHRFRDSEQYNTQALYYALERRDGGCKVLSPHGRVVVLKPRKAKDYIARKLRLIDSSQGVKFCCMNSLDKASESEVAMIREWACRKIGVTLPDNMAK